MKSNHVCSRCGEEDITAPPEWVWMPSIVWTFLTLLVVFVAGIVKILEILV